MKVINNKLIVFIGLGFEITGLIVGSVLLGQLLDSNFETKGLITSGLILLSFVTWVVHMIRMLKKFNS